MPRSAGDPTELRAQALEEARDLMRAGGPEKVKARVLALRLGVSVGTIYNLFGSLDELFLALNAEVYDALYETVSEARREAVRAKGDTTDQMLALARAYLHFVAENAEIWSGVLTYNRAARDAPPAWYRRKELALLSVITETIDALPGARGAGQRDIATRALWAAVHGIVTISVARGGLLAPEEEVAEQLELVVRSVARTLS